MTEQEQVGTQDSSELGEQLLTAVERIIDEQAEILAVVERHFVPGETGTDRHAERVITHYSNKSALAGGATALPSLIPGIGTATALIAGPLADMVFLLKYETELCLALSAVHGFDITDPSERQFAFLLAALKTAELQGNRSVVCDGVQVTTTAISHWGPHQLQKGLVSMLGMVALAAMSRSLVRVVPLVGIAVGAGMNKVYTRKVGRQAHDELRLRRRLDARKA